MHGNASIDCISDNCGVSDILLLQIILITHRYDYFFFLTTSICLIIAFAGRKVYYTISRRPQIITKMVTKQGISTVTVYFLVVLLLMLNQVSHAENSWTVKWQYEPKCNFTDKNIETSDECLLMHMESRNTINLTINHLDSDELKLFNATIRIVSASDLLKVSKEIPLSEIVNRQIEDSFMAEAIFIGKSDIYVEIVKIINGERKIETSPKLHVIIIRPERLIDKLFIVSVATLVSILYINFGAALDLGKVKGVLKRPIGPAIAFFCHFIVLPLVGVPLQNVHCGFAQF